MTFHAARALCVMLGAVLAAAVIAGAADSAQAHERRTVEGYEFVVGWREEPAFLGEVNGVDLGVTRPAAGASEGAPVEGLEQTLRVEVFSGGDRRTLELRPRFRMPGRYTADLLPTRAGDYRFRFFGTIEGRPIDATFDSADGKFDGVQPVAAIQFPRRAPDVVEVDRALGLIRGMAAAALALSVVALVLGGGAMARARGMRGRGS